MEKGESVTVGKNKKGIVVVYVKVRGHGGGQLAWVVLVVWFLIDMSLFEKKESNLASYLTDAPPWLAWFRVQRG